MPASKLDKVEIMRAPYTLLWALLAFQAGYINTFGFLTSGRYVSHVTGLSTQIGHSLVSDEFIGVVQLLSFVIAFIAGAFVSGLFTSARQDQKKVPRFALSAALMPMILGVLLVLGVAGVFGPFGDETWMLRNYGLVLALMFASGLQNGCFSVLTQNQIRTTHMTGTSTDYGVELARLWMGGLPSDERRAVSEANRTRLILLVSFAVGALVAGAMSAHTGHLSLIIPLFTSIVSWTTMIKIQRKITYLTLKEMKSRATPQTSRV